MDEKAPWEWAKRIVAGLFFLLLFVVVAWFCYAALHEVVWRSYETRI